MPNTKEGGRKVSATIREKYGNDYWVKLGALGGAKKNPNKGFGGNRELARIAGKRGGTISRRRPTSEYSTIKKHEGILGTVKRIFVHE